MLLTRCAECSSKLLQLERMWLLVDGRHVAGRRCPECDTVDHVTASPEALWAWRRLAQRQRERLEQTVVELVEGIHAIEPAMADQRDL
jgi:Zn ribbon nucleic-acid-binding protein